MNDQYKKIANVFRQTETKIAILYPAIVRALKKYKGEDLKLIDIGCGTGDYYNTITKLGFNYEGIDRSESMLSIARSRYPEAKFENLTANNFTDKLNRKFDIALLNLVLQDNPKDVELKIIQETSKSLKRNGIAIVGIHHPSFDHYMRFGLLHESKTKTEFSGYFATQKYFLKYFFGKTAVDFTDYHITLSEYCRMFTESEFVILDIDECEPNKHVLKSKNKLYKKLSYPTYMVITLKKSSLN